MLPFLGCWEAHSRKELSTVFPGVNQQPLSFSSGTGKENWKLGSEYPLQSHVFHHVTLLLVPLPDADSTIDSVFMGAVIFEECKQTSLSSELDCWVWFPLGMTFIYAGKLLKLTESPVCKQCSLIWFGYLWPSVYAMFHYSAAFVHRLQWTIHACLWQEIGLQDVWQLRESDEAMLSNSCTKGPRCTKWTVNKWQCCCRTTDQNIFDMKTLRP